MVEIKPYLSDEDEDENWIPLNPRTSHHCAEQPDLAAVSASTTANIDEGGATNILPAIEDEDEEWEKLNSSHIISEHQSQAEAAAAAAPVSSLMELFPALSSITKVTTVSASEENDDENSESGENIVWRRPNALEDDKDIQNFRRDRGDAGISERYDDDKISAMRFDPSENNELHMQGSIPKNVEKEKQKSSTGSNEKPVRQEERDQQQPPPPRPEPQQQQQHRPHPSTRIKSKLQEKFIHDPLRSLPYHFMRNFFLEAKYQLTLAWKCYFNHDDADRDDSNELSMDTGALAAVILYSIVGMFALGLILSGVYDVGLALVSTLIWSMETSLKTSGDGMMSTVLTTLILGMVIWLASRFKSRDWFQETFRFPTLSNIVPMIVAFTSTSMYEAAVIGLSVRTIISICETGAMNMGCPTGLATVGLVFISSTFSIFLVMNLVSFSALEMGENLHGKYIRRMRAHSYECHALGITTLVVLCIALVLLRDGVFIFSSLRLVRICLSIGIGIFTLESLWNSILEAIASKNNLGVANGMSLRHISRRALTKSLFDLSTSAFWSKDDMGNVMLGILSEEDSELRYAILGWILDRWTATSNDQSTEGRRDATANDQLAEEPPSLNEPNSSPEESQTPGSTEDPRPPLRSKNSASCSHSDGAKFETKDGNDGRCNEAKFRATSSDFPANDGRSSTPSYQSLQSVISRLDADETLIPAINRYSEWVNSLRPNPNVALCLAMWKLCPAMVVFGVATIYSVVSGIVQAILFCTIGSTSAENIGSCLYVCIVAVVLWPLLLIEYFSLSRWWAKHFEGQEIVPDSVIIMLESEDLSPRLFFYPIALATDTSAFLLRVWKLLLESISFLQSSVPAVRCATVACCTADLAVDTLCLVDLAFEVQKRGVIGGIGMLIFDAFNHHLKEELQQRRSNEGIESDEHEGLGSKYTGAVINSARNIGKISQNIGGLMQKEVAVKSEDHDDEGRSAKEGSSENSSATEDYKEVPEVSTDGKGSDSSARGVVKEKETSPLQSEDVRSGAETQETCTPEVEYEIKSKEKKEGDNHLMPVLIGGSLAVLGAFVGGMTVAAAKNRNDDEKRSSKD